MSGNTATLKRDVRETWRTVFQGIIFITCFTALIQIFGRNHIYCVTLRIWQNIFLRSSHKLKLVHCNKRKKERVAHPSWAHPLQELNNYLKPPA